MCWPALPARAPCRDCRRLCPQAVGGGKEWRRKRNLPLVCVRLSTGSPWLLGCGNNINDDDRSTERFSHLPQATQQDLNKVCLTGKPVFIQDPTYCRLIKVMVPTGHLTAPSPMAVSQTADPAPQASLARRAASEGQRLTPQHIALGLGWALVPPEDITRNSVLLCPAEPVAQGSG